MCVLSSAQPNFAVNCSCNHAVHPFVISYTKKAKRAPKRKAAIAEGKKIECEREKGQAEGGGGGSNQTNTAMLLLFDLPEPSFISHLIAYVICGLLQHAITSTRRGAADEHESESEKETERAMGKKTYEVTPPTTTTTSCNRLMG